MGGKGKAENKNRANRWQFRLFLLYPTVIFYTLLFLLDGGLTIGVEFNEVLASIVIGNFACSITAVSIFAVFDYKEKHPILLTDKSRVWFIDAVALALYDLMFSLVFLIGSRQALIFIVMISCYHTFMIFHYYLRERFKKNKKSKVGKDADQEPHDEHDDNDKKDADEPERKFPLITVLDAIILFVPVILLLFFKWAFTSNPTVLLIIFITVFVLCLTSCILTKHLLFERKSKHEDKKFD